MAVHVGHQVKPDLSVFERNAAPAYHDSALLALAQEWLAAMNLQVFEDASGLRYGLFNGWHDEASNTDLSTLFLFNPACCQVLTMPCFEPQLAQDLSKAFANNLAQLSSDYSAHALADLERVLVQAVSQCQNVIPRNLNLLTQSSAVSIEEGELVWHLSSQESGFVPANTDFPIVRPAHNSFKGLRFYSHLKAQDTPNSIAIGKNVGRLAESTGCHISPLGAQGSELHLIYPKAGQLILFPSWLEHAVQENQSNQSRYSIPINTKPLKG
ncbi:MAG: putative 2OG-Fe(II) oxygenase [Thiomicrospira sp.]